MLPSSFEYVAPTTVDEAVQALAAGGGDAKVVAGGQSLLPMMKLRLAAPGTLVDINGIAGLDVLEEADGMLRIGALVRHGDLERSDLIRDRYPIIHDAARHIADPLIRNRGTFCGSIAHGDPAGDWATVASALNAELHAVGPDGPAVHSARDFQTGMFETKLGLDQVLVEARIPQPVAGQGSACLKVERKVGDYAAAAVGVVVVLDGDTVKEADIGLTNVGLTIDAADAAASLVGRSIDDAAALAGQPASVSLIASRRRAAAALDLLRERGVAEELIAAIDTRPGIELGEATQEEIALAVVAGIVQRLRATGAERPRTAIDPTSGSEILVDETTPTAEHEGVTYYFSCNGCKGRFLEDPARYVGAAPTA